MYQENIKCPLYVALIIILKTHHYNMSILVKFVIHIHKSPLWTLDIHASYKINPLNDIYFNGYNCKHLLP